MTIGQMLGYTERLKSIIQSGASQRVKDFRLANLMDDLEGAFQIPALRDKSYEKVNPHVIQLYRTVSAERSL